MPLYFGAPRVLFFADDGLMLTKSLQETKTLMQTISKVSKKCGLDINKEKSAIIIYNCKEQPAEIEGIPVTDNLIYLGLKVENQRNMFKV